MWTCACNCSASIRSQKCIFQPEIPDNLLWNEVFYFFFVICTWLHNLWVKTWQEAFLGMGRGQEETFLMHRHSLKNDSLCVYRCPLVTNITLSDTHTLANTHLLDFPSLLSLHFIWMETGTSRPSPKPFMGNTWELSDWWHGGDLLHCCCFLAQCGRLAPGWFLFPHPCAFTTNYPPQHRPIGASLLRLCHIC